MDLSNAEYLILVPLGLLSMAGGLFDWQWFINNWRVRAISKLLGRTGARLFYTLLGLGLVVLGYLLAFNLLPG
jgi:small neutral amino acid transporter SnatA (MarC family)